MIGFHPRPALHVRFAGRERWIHDLVLDNDPLREVRVMTGAALIPPSESVVPADPQSGPWAEFAQRLNKVDAGDFSTAARLNMSVVGALTRVPLPRVSTAIGTQGQVPFSLPGWDLVLAVSDEQPFGDQLLLSLEATPNAGQTISHEEIATLGLLLQGILSFLAGSNVGVLPLVGLNAVDEVVAARWAAPRVDFDRAALRWCYEVTLLQRCRS